METLKKWALVALFVVLAALGIYAIWVYVLPLMWGNNHNKVEMVSGAVGCWICFMLLRQKHAK